MNYDHYISDVVKEIPPSGIRKYFDLLDETYISFGVGEPDFPTPERIRQAALKRLSTGRIAYTSNSGDPYLRELILRYLDERFGLRGYEGINNVLITVGASQAIDLAMRAIITPGDEVIVHEPSYVAYKPAVSLAGGVPVSVMCHAEDRFRLRADVLRAAITPKTKALLLAFPSNPTGGIMEKEDLEEIAKVVIENDLLVISDEIYAELTFNGKRHVSIASLPGMRERTIVLNGFSKAFSMTGWRLGYAAGPAEIISAMRKVHQLTMLSAPTTAQYAGIAALEYGFDDGFADVEYMMQEYAKRRKLIIEHFTALGLTCHEPEGAFYVFPSISATGMKSEAFCDALLAAQKVVFVPGDAFGKAGEGFIRACYATSVEDIERAFVRVEAFMRTL